MSKVKSRLGRGLSSLISVQEEIPVEPVAPVEQRSEPVRIAESPSPAVSPNTIPISQIIPNPHQPRRAFSEKSLAELGASIKSNGLIQPILVRKEGERYELIAGERRWRASKLAGLTEIPAIIRDVDGLTQAQIALVENIQREDLNAIDRATAYRALLDQLGLTQAELAGRLGEDRSAIANFLRLLDLPPTVQAMVGDGRLTVGHGKVLAGVPDATEQTRLAELTISQGLSVRNLERLTQEQPTAQTGRADKPAPSAHIADLERSVARQLGMKVQIKSGAKGKGKLTVHYASLDQFDELMSKLGVSVE